MPGPSVLCKLHHAPLQLIVLKRKGTRAPDQLAALPNHAAAARSSCCVLSARPFRLLLLLTPPPPVASACDCDQPGWDPGRCGCRPGYVCAGSWLQPCQPGAPRLKALQWQSRFWFRGGSLGAVGWLIAWAQSVAGKHQSAFPWGTLWEAPEETPIYRFPAPLES